MCECVTLVNGGVKTGKSTLSVYLALKYYKKNLRKWKLRKWLLHKEEEMPLLYSNIPLNCKWGYTPITNDILNRTKRVAFGSVCYIGEFSLVADSQAFKDQNLNERIMLFIKLFGHETHGSGKVFLDTQAIADCHYAIKRCISRYIYIERSIKWIPFIILFKVREMYYSDDNNIINTSEEDIEDNANKFLMITKSVWKKFDYTCYSCFTDSLEKEEFHVDYPNTLKATVIPSFKNYNTIPVAKSIDEIKESEMIKNGQ